MLQQHAGACPACWVCAGATAAASQGAGAGLFLLLMLLLLVVGRLEAGARHICPASLVVEGVLRLVLRSMAFRLL